MKRQFTVGAVFVLVTAAVVQAQTVLCVDASADQTPHDGSDWAHAFVTLQDALDAAQPDTVICVAAGTYLPTKQLEEGVARTETFQLLSGVTLEGGYAGYGAADPDQRDNELYETILSGDIGVAGDPSDNCYHVVVASGVDSTAVLDGFTITGGNADGGEYPYYYGAGVCICGGAPTISACAIRANSAVWGGAGMINEGGDAYLADCVFEDNHAEYSGGGLCSFNGGSPVVIRCLFARNFVGATGGGMRSFNSSPNVMHCMFVENQSNSDAGGMDNSLSNVQITSCRFLGNSAGNFGGGMRNSASDVALTQCAFIANSAERSGGGLANFDGSVRLVNCVFTVNEAESGGGLHDDDGVVTLTNSIIARNLADSGPSLYRGGWNSSIVASYCCIQGGWLGETNIDEDPLFVDIDGGDDAFGTEDDDVRLESGSPCIDAGDNSALLANIAADLGGFYRLFDDRATPDRGYGVAPIVDMGVYEFGSTEPPLWGDLNCDGAANAFDIDPFVIALLSVHNYRNAYPQCHYGLADCNGDGAVNAFDIDPFVLILVGG